jgi:phage/plasmid-like protein (TIGR03299 family)
MSHEIDFSKGYAAMFSVLVPVWHQAETGAKVLAYHPTVEEALHEAGLDYPVIKVPTLRVLPDGTTVQNTLAYSTVRGDTGAELGMVGKDYTPLQNTDALRVFQPLLDSGHAVIETAGALRGGADIWVMVAWNLNKFSAQVQRVFGEEPRGGALLPYSLITNNHNGRRNVIGLDTTVAVVCANTLGMALSGAQVRNTEEREGQLNGNAFAVRHTSQVKEKLEEQATALWSQRVATFDLIAAQYAVLQRTTLDAGAFARTVLDVAAPDPRLHKGWNPEARLANVVLDRWATKRATITRYWTDGTGHTGDHSAWEAYNGLAEVLDHDTELFPTRGGVYRTQALLMGRLGSIKQAVINRLVDYAQSVQ